MTPVEFKAWFEGFTENIKGTPSAAQWKRIKKRAKEINDTPTLHRWPYYDTWTFGAQSQPYYMTNTAEIQKKASDLQVQVADIPGWTNIGRTEANEVN